MAVLSKDEFTKRLQERFGESTEEADLSFVEDLTDTYDNLSSNELQNRLTEVQKNYDDLKAKYRDRFFNKGTQTEEEPEVAEDKPKTYRFEDLFK